MANSVLFDDIKSNIRPLDMFVFRGIGLLADAICETEERVMGNGDWSHCGLVVTTDVVPIENGKPGVLYIWESAAGDLPDVELGYAIIGVQVRELAAVVKDHNKCAPGRTGWCKLRANPLCDAATKDKCGKQLAEIYAKYNHKEYDLNPFELAAPFWSWCGRLGNCLEDAMRMCLRLKSEQKLPWTIRDSNGLFCSELVALTYVELGILPDTVRPHDIAPVEFLGWNNEQQIPVVHESPIVII